MIFYTPEFANKNLSGGKNWTISLGVAFVHLLIDGYNGNRNRLQDKTFLRQFLLEYPDILGMNRISDPVVLEYSAPKSEDSGLSGFVIIAESHISFHTFPNRAYINIDVFSCKSFDSAKALAELTERFGLQGVRSWVINRGLEHFDPQTEGFPSDNAENSSLNTW